MGKFRIEVTAEAQTHISKHLKSGNQSSIKKIAKILEELAENPFEGVGKPEALKHELSGLWSREINKKDRLLYRVKEEIVTVVVISAMGHYSDR
ncbi:Txe/YoeB family addiction module toxin [Flavobacterium sp. ANB]|jgi:toxin YoeB|uniref:Txe/YoeB family addiction module toxin n=1 Tax=unclassified Flavobacterium TaxID=196869 RepID=UPI0012B7FAB7|nr:MULTISPECIES: Txe/YoeB family addiction module toxin [unclassified Flavobacterium]MBF4518921.1 Txe/YoeB family addiction module toxin [Flavobacterium sp. ANB]MTD71366.1 Txe/YoeB family addiction module toxin [Flavobacterium sp. LC2016-13]